MAEFLRCLWKGDPLVRLKTLLTSGTHKHEIIQTQNFSFFTEKRKLSNGWCDACKFHKRIHSGNQVLCSHSTTHIRIRYSVFNSFYGINKRRRTQFSKRLKRESREKNSFYLEHKCLEFPTPAAVNGHKENSSMSWVFCQKLDSSDVVESPFSVSRCFPTNWLRYQHCSVFTTNFKTFSSVQSSISLSNKRTFHECNPNKTGIRYVTFWAVISEKR